MKRSILIALIVFFAGTTILAQDGQYQVLPDAKEGKFLKGIISREALSTDTSFKWYAENLKGYTPNSDGLAALKKNADSIELLVFMGTWCHDSHFIIPKFFTLTDAAGISKDKITLIGVDRDKKTLSHLSEALGITNVPTIMVMKKGKEMGRVIEYGKFGMWDKEIGDILNGKQ